MASNQANSACRSNESGAIGVWRAIGSSLLLFTGIALVLTVIFTASQDLDASGFLAAFVVNFIISAAIGGSLEVLYRIAYNPMRQRIPGRFAGQASHVITVIVGVTLGVEVAIRIIGVLGGPSPDSFRPDVLRIGLVVATVVVVTMFTFERLRSHARTVELRAEQAQREALRSQLQALQARTNPHFLFNSLNTVAGLIEEDPQSAERVLERLTNLFRYSLEGSKTSWVRIEDEIAAVRDYVAVEQIRLGDRLRVVVEIDPELEEMLVPPLILQPLVENAILHAVAPRRAGGSVTVRAHRSRSTAVLSVSDDGPGLGNSPHNGSGSSLSELRQRLELVYRNEARLETFVPTGGGCEVRLTIPAQTIVEERSR